MENGHVDHLAVMCERRIDGGSLRLDYAQISWCKQTWPVWERQWAKALIFTTISRMIIHLALSWIRIEASSDYCYILQISSEKVKNIFIVNAIRDPRKWRRLSTGIHRGSKKDVTAVICTSVSLHDLCNPIRKERFIRLAYCLTVRISYRSRKMKRRFQMHP